MSVDWKPKTMPTLTPAMPGGRKLIDFLSKVFDAKAEHVYEGPGGSVGHAEVRIGESLIMTGDEMPGHELPPAAVMVYVKDVDATFKRALDAGATTKDAIKNQFYGDRSGTVVDAFGNRWTISTHIEDVSEEEMNRRIAEMVKPAGG